MKEDKQMQAAIENWKIERDKARSKEFKRYQEAETQMDSKAIP